MTSASRRTRVLVIAGLVSASVALHAVTLGLLPRLVRRPALVEMTAIALELHDAPVPVAEPPAALRNVESVATPAPNERPHAPRASSASSAAVSADEPAAATEPVAERAPPEPAPPAERQRIDIDPRRAALSSLSTATEPVAAAGARDDLAASRGAELSAELRVIANANPAREHRTPQLVHDADGTCHYAGDAIDATILPDGGVRFEDKPPDVRASSLQPLARGQFLPRGGPQLPPEHPVTPEEMLPPQQLEFRVRVTPRAWQAERDWFLRETEALRRELADGAHARALVQGEHDLRKRLDHIWCNPSQPAAERRRALFLLWDDTSADEVGARGRGTILQYVRDNLPKGSPFAFPETQLAALNAHKTQRERFDPYAAGAPDADATDRSAASNSR